MRENTLRTKWAAGKATVNAWCGVPSPILTEFLAQCGWDSITVDMQHGLVDYQAMVGMLQAISTTSTIPMVRVPWNEAGIIMKSLDAGAYGIICPMVNTRAQAEEFVSYCRYAPKGQRSFGPTRATIYGGSDYGAKANETVLAIAMIETVEAMSNIDAIMSTPGLDGVYIGPADLALSMGRTPMLDPTDAKVLAEIRKIIDATKKHKSISGMQAELRPMPRR